MPRVIKFSKSKKMIILKLVLKIFFDKIVIFRSNSIIRAYEIVF